MLVVGIPSFVFVFPFAFEFVFVFVFSFVFVFVFVFIANMAGCWWWECLKEFRLLELVCSARNKLAPWVPRTASQVSQGKQTTPRDTQRLAVRVRTFVQSRLMSGV